MTTLTIQIEEAEKEFLKKVLKRMTVNILAENPSAPNELARKTINDAELGKGLSEPVTEVKHS